MTTSRRIEIAGSIAAGKSTLCAFLGASGYRIIGEKIHENPYPNKVYAEPANSGFYRKMGFLLSKCAAIEEKSDDPRPAVCDYALIVEYAYAVMHMKDSDPAGFELSNKCVDFLLTRIGAPDLIVYIRSTPDIQMARIRERMKADPGRDFEKTLTPDYLVRLNAEIENQVVLFRDSGGRVLELHGDILDFRKPEEARAVLAMIQDCTNSGPTTSGTGPEVSVPRPG